MLYAWFYFYLNSKLKMRKMRSETAKMILVALLSTSTLCIVADCRPIMTVRKPRGAPPESRAAYNSTKDYNLICQEYYQSPDYVWEPVQEVCIPCGLCEGSQEAYCQACNRATTTKPPEDFDPSTHPPVTAGRKTEVDPIVIGVYIVIGVVIVINIIMIVSLCYFIQKRKKGGNYKAVSQNPPVGEEEGVGGGEIEGETLPLRSDVPQQDHEPVPEYHPLDPNIVTTGTPESSLPGNGIVWV